MKIKITINGKKFNKKNFMDIIEQAIIEEVISDIKNSIKNLSCNIHNKEVQINITYTNIGDFTFTAESCCQSFENIVIQNIIQE